MARTPRELALELRAQRERLGWTQADLATRAGVSREYVVRLESGKLKSEVGLLMEVVDALGFELSLVLKTESDDYVDDESLFADVYRRTTGDPKNER